MFIDASTRFPNRWWVVFVVIFFDIIPLIELLTDDNTDTVKVLATIFLMAVGVSGAIVIWKVASRDQAGLHKNG